MTNDYSKCRNCDSRKWLHDADPNYTCDNYEPLDNLEYLEMVYNQKENLNAKEK